MVSNFVYASDRRGGGTCVDGSLSYVSPAEAATLSGQSER
jgi:hypothetical protein